MKKILLFASALAGLFFAGSCQRENLEPIGGNTVTYTVTVPDALATKGIGEDISAVDELVYEVYRTQEEGVETFTPVDNFLYHKTAPITNGVATIELEFVNNQNFTVLFWAHTKDNRVYDVDDLTCVTIESPDAANNVNAQAFVGRDFVRNCVSDADGKVTLTRPVSQLNIATTPESLGKFQDVIELKGSSVKVTGLATSYNIGTLSAFGATATEYEYTKTAVPDEALTVNGVGYTYVAMNYVGFAANDGSSDVTVSYVINTSEGDIENEIINVPFKPNYRTNIVGNLITSMSDYTITLDKEWEGVYVGPEFVQVPAYDAEHQIWTVTNADELAWVAASVNGTIGLQTKAGATSKTFKGETVVLANDIDLQGKPWTPIGNGDSANRYEYLFGGTFDGQGHSIKNMNVDYTECAGLFGRICGATIKNVTIDGFNLKSDHYAGAIIGWAETGANPITVENCKALNGTITVNVAEIEDGRHDLGDKAGAIVGYSHHGNYKKNEVNNVIIEGYRDLGAIVGYGKNSVVTDNKIANVTLVQNLECDYKKDEEGGSTPDTIHDFVGRGGDTCTIDRNEGTATIVTAVASGVYASKKETNSEGETIVTEYSVYAAEGLEWVSSQVDQGPKGSTFEGVTIQLLNDLDLSNENWNPIGDNRTDGAAFSGTFDGNGHTIKGAHITGADCFNGAVYGSKEGWGLFSVTDGATIKNLKVDGATFGSYTVISGTIAGYANNTTFENIEISNTKIAGYNWYTGGVVGWAAGECTFKDINLDSTVSVGTLWDSHGQNAGGIAGGISSEATITIEDCNIACVLDVINDITSNYKWCVYRVAGMIIGNTNTTETKYNEVVTATATNVTCKNVTVTYGDWMNYHYCQGYWNRGWGRYESSDYVGGVDQSEPHNHPDGESHYVCIPFDQLFGGSSNGSGHYPVKGLAEFPGVTVNYPASYRREVSSAAALTEALGKGVSVILDTDIDFGSTQLAITGENQVVDLGGHALTTANNWGGISLKNGATIKNGTITHAGNTAAIKAFNGSSVENVTINATCATADKTVTGIAVQQGATVESIKNVTINGVSQGIEVGYQATVGLIENAVVNESNNGTAKGIGLVINGGMVGKAKDCSFKGETYGITLHLKGVFDAGLELENCTVEGASASIYAWDEKGISNTSGSLVLTYDAATTLTGQFVWDFEDECKDVLTLNRP